MSRRYVGLVATGLGLALMLLGLLMLGGSDDPKPPTTTLTAAPTTTLAPTSTTTVPATTTAPTTTTTTTPPETLEEFVAAYRLALDSDDVTFLFSRLHPKVIETQGAEFCRAWIEREVIALDNYQIAGEISGPADQMFPAPDGSQFAIADTFSTTVAFTIQGESFQREAGFALVDNVMYWLGTCA
jgi:hypothetical protein